jgi:hypothetical protein
MSAPNNFKVQEDMSISYNGNLKWSDRRPVVQFVVLFLLSRDVVYGIDLPVIW